MHNVGDELAFICATNSLLLWFNRHLSVTAEF